MSELGQRLKEARLQKGLTLDDVQELTKIRKRYLEAIEAGDYQVLPGSFYVRAFIKTYAEAVGINGEELMEIHHKEVPGPATDPTIEPVIQKTRTRQHNNERNSKWLSTVLMWSFALLIFVVIYLVIDASGKGDVEKDNKTPDNTSVTNSGSNTPNKPPVNNTDDPANGSGEGEGQGQDDQVVDEPTKTEPTSVAIIPDGKSGRKTKFIVQKPKDAVVSVEINASGKSWVEVYRGNSDDGEKLFFNNTSSGDVLTYDLTEEGIYIKSGYSPATVVTVDGQVVDDGKTSSYIVLNLEDTEASTD